MEAEVMMAGVKQAEAKQAEAKQVEAVKAEANQWRQRTNGGGGRWRRRAMEVLVEECAPIFVQQLALSK